MVILDYVTFYTYLLHLKDLATSEKMFMKLNTTIFHVHGLPLSIVLDQDSRFTSKVLSPMMMPLGIPGGMATQYRHQTNGQVEGRIQALKDLMRNFVNLRQNNWSGALPAIAAARNLTSHESLGIITRYHSLDMHPRKIFSPVQSSASK